MKSAASSALKKYFGHSSLREGQEQVIGQVLDGTNTLAILPTGGGKSLCYQLPAVVSGGLTVVVSPLIALMRDQVDALVRKGVPAARWDSSSEDEFEVLSQQLSEGALKLLYISPERLLSKPLLHLLRGLDVSLVAIDEAHCVSEWGHSFRPAYIKLSKVVRTLKPRSILALTATATPQVAREIRRAFNILKRDQVQTSFYRNNLHYAVQAAADEDKDKVLLETLTRAGSLPAVVYAMSRDEVERLASFLSGKGVAARAFHAGMPPKVRGDVQDDFLHGEFPVMCATIAFGMGVDMPNIRTVVHYQPPKSPEGWLQESGRAGRDGRTSRCEMLVNENDRERLESMILSRRPTLKAIENILSNVFSQGTRAVVSRYNMSTLNDVSMELVDILLARLEVSGRITSDDGSWLWCSAVPLIPIEKILSGFKPAEQKTLHHFLETRGRVSLMETSDGTAAGQAKLMKLLAELRETGDARTSFSHSLLHFRIKKQPNNMRSLAEEMYGVCNDHIADNLARINDVFRMVSSRRCLAQSMLKHFGESLSNRCGECSSCLGKHNPRKLPYTAAEEITDDEFNVIREMVRNPHPALSSSERIARYLCGIYSPAMMRYRLYQRDTWALIARLPYDHVRLTVSAIKT
ncbi:MAG: RecQ family ATP-dependent DNA helicase [Akkermansiaceae bacterium]